MRSNARLVWAWRLPYESPATNHGNEQAEYNSRAACGRMDDIEGNLGETIPLMTSPQWPHLSQLIRSERVLNMLVGGLNAFNSRRATHNLLRLVRLQRRHKPAGVEPPPKRPPIPPRGPSNVDARHGCALLVFVPRSLESRLIDDATG